MEEKENLFTIIKAEVKKIPKGKVATYGQIAKKVGITDSRKVGWAIWGNQDKTIPCHRVVKKDGSLAEKFSLGGASEHKRRLEEDGILFNGEDDFKVDLSIYGF